MTDIGIGVIIGFPLGMVAVIVFACLHDTVKRRAYEQVMKEQKERLKYHG